MEAGKPYNIGLGAPSQIRRIEAGILSYGADMTINENPFELGFERLVDLEQDAEFIGKTALKRIKTEGIKRRLVGVEIHGASLDSTNEHPWPVISDGSQPGKLTSCVYSPRLGKNIGLALVPLAHSQAGSMLTIDTPYGKRQATVVPLPFYDPKKTIPTS